MKEVSKPDTKESPFRYFEINLKAPRDAKNFGS